MRGAVRRTIYRTASGPAPDQPFKKNAAAQVGFRACVCRMIAASSARSPVSMRSRIPTALGACLLASTLALWARPESGGWMGASGVVHGQAATVAQPRPGPQARSGRGPRRHHRDGARSLRQGAGSGVPVFGRGDAAGRGTHGLPPGAGVATLAVDRGGRQAGVAPLAHDHQARRGRPPHRPPPGRRRRLEAQGPRQDATPGSSTSR